MVRKQTSFIVWVALLWAISLWALPPIRIPGGEDCVFSRLPRSSSALFAPAERQTLLGQSAPSPLAFRDQSGKPLSEKQLVDQAIARFIAGEGGLSPRAKAALWESLMAQIDQFQESAPYRVSYGFVWKHDGQTYYVYQGPLEFPTGHYTLVIHPDGQVSMGAAPLIQGIQNWSPDLNRLRPLSPPHPG